MRYKTYCKAKDYSMKNVLPAFREVQKEYALDKDNIFYKYGEALAYCGNSKIVSVCQDCHTSYYNGAYMCKNRFCPVCQKQKSLILFSKVYPKILELMDKGYYVNVMTFTIKDTENLKLGINLLKTAYRNITHSSQKTREVYSNMFIGGIKSLEVKRGKNSNLWHPHFHALVIKDKFSKDYECLNTLWNKEIRRLVNDSDDTIYEDKFYVDEKLGNVWISNLNTANSKTKVKAVYECIKYITKYEVNDLVHDLKELVYGLKGIRSVDSWGVLRGIEKDAEEQELSPISVKDLVCKECGSFALTILDGITIEELENLGISTDFKDFETKENRYDEEEF